VKDLAHDDGRGDAHDDPHPLQSSSRRAGVRDSGGRFREGRGQIGGSGRPEVGLVPHLESLFHDNLPDDSERAERSQQRSAAIQGMKIIEIGGNRQS
jgi:hypothetical protein